LAVRPLPDVLRSSQTNAELIEEVDVEHVTPFPLAGLVTNQRLAWESTEQISSQVLNRRGFVAGQVDSQVGRGPLKVFVLAFAQLDRRAVGRQHLNVQAQRLQLFE